MAPDGPAQNKNNNDSNKTGKMKTKKGFFTIKEANSQTSVCLPTIGEKSPNRATNEQYSTDPFSKLTTAC